MTIKKTQDPKTGTRGRIPFFVKLDGKAFAEGAAGDAWFEAVRELKCKHPLYGPMEITEARIDGFIENFKNGVRGIFDEEGAPTLDIDFEHKFSTNGGRAAGWIKDLKKGVKILKDGKTVKTLLVKPLWTPDARVAIKNGEYKYFSIEWTEEYLDPEKNQTFFDVLFGGGITNRPFVKDLSPISLSEDSFEVFAEQEQKEGGPSMDELKKALTAAGISFSEDAKEADLMKLFSDSLSKANEALKKAESTVAEKEKAFAEVKAEADKAAGEVKVLSEKVSGLEKEIDSFKTAEKSAKKEALLKLAEKKVDPAGRASWLSELIDKDFALAEKTVAALPEILKTEATGKGTGSDDEKGLSDLDIIHKRTLSEVEKKEKVTGIKDPANYRELYPAVKAAYEAEKTKNKGA